MTVTTSLTVHWVPLAGHRRYRNVAAQAVGAEVAEGDLERLRA